MHPNMVQFLGQEKDQARFDEVERQRLLKIANFGPTGFQHMARIITHWLENVPIVWGQRLSAFEIGVNSRGRKTFLKYALYISIIVILFALTACGSAASATTADAIAGVWAGEMSFSDGPDTIQVEVVIPEGCTPGEVCGTSYDITDGCKFEFAFDSLEKETYAFKNLRTLEGDCPALGVVYYTMQADDRLYRLLETPEWTGEVLLTRK